MLSPKERADADAKEKAARAKAEADAKNKIADEAGATGGTGAFQPHDRSEEAQRPGMGMVGGSGARGDPTILNPLRSKASLARIEREAENDAKKAVAIEEAVKNLNAAEEAIAKMDAEVGKARVALQVAESNAAEARALYREAADAHFQASRMVVSPGPDEPARPQPAVLS